MASPKKASAELVDTPRLYELVGIIPGSVSEKEAQKIVTETKKLVTAASADITVEDLWPRRALAYPIHHETEGWYLVLNFTALPNAMKGLNKALRMESKLIRFLIVTKPQDYTNISLENLQARVKEAKEASLQVSRSPSAVHSPRSRLQQLRRKPLQMLRSTRRSSTPRSSTSTKPSDLFHDHV